MARITVEDCMDHCENLFELVLMASKRARRLANGAPAQVEWENDKPTVVALREIAAGLVTRDILDEPDEPTELAFDQTVDELTEIAARKSALEDARPSPLGD